MNWFLKFTYILGPETGTSDYIGPFPTTVVALDHRDAYGPSNAEIVQAALPPDVTRWLTPEQHIEYVSKRL